MAKLTLSNLVNLENEVSAVATMNANSDATEAAMEKTLSRTGEAPNQMLAVLDMNNNQIINIGNPTTSFSPVRLTDLEAAVATLSAQINAIVNAPNHIGTNFLSNIRNPKFGAYTVLTTDQGKTIALSGAVFYPVTFPAASGFPVDFQVVVVNEDTVRAKSVILPTETFYLWPGQSVIVYNDNNVWRTIGRSRWRPPGTTVNLYADFTNGSDSNDGLAGGVGNAFKTVQHAMYVANDQFDFAGSDLGQTRVVVNMAANTTDTVGIHYSSHALVGAQGGAVMRIQGTTGSRIAAVNTDAVGVFCNAIIQLDTIQLATTTGGAGITAGLGAQVYVLSGVQFYSCAGPHMNASNGSRIYLNNDYQIWGGASQHVLAQTGGLVLSQGPITITFGAPAAFSYFILTSFLGCANYGGCTFNLNSYTVTGKRHEADALSVIGLPTGGLFPGNVVGTVSTGGVAL